MTKPQPTQQPCRQESIKETGSLLRLARQSLARNDADRKPKDHKKDEAGQNPGETANLQIRP